ncbi:MAG TPA: GspH/FimT family pseudopilin [Casimicrobiaceae bacterium]|nr:GspH/FimT family pseudopilin [Casimicrobiaceae bacterium]
MKRGSQTGFTLIELLIALAIFGFLILLAGPMYGQFMGNHQIRNGTDAMLNGVQQAQGAAVSHNALARLVVDFTTGTGGWRVLQTIDGAESATPVQIYKVHEGADRASFTPVPADATQITFDGFGRIVPNVDASSTLTCIKVTNSNVSNPHNLNVAINVTGLTLSRTKLCDPALPKDDPTEPLSCPTACS